MTEYARVDVAALRRYLAGEDIDPTVQPPWRILELAYNALLAAGVIEFDDGSPFAERATIDVESDGVTLRSETGSVYWDIASMPPFDGLIASFAYHFATTMNEPPTEGTWPKHFT